MPRKLDWIYAPLAYAETRLDFLPTLFGDKVELVWRRLNKSLVNTVQWPDLSGTYPGLSTPKITQLQSADQRQVLEVASDRAVYSTCDFTRTSDFVIAWCDVLAALLGSGASLVAQQASMRHLHLVVPRAGLDLTDYLDARYLSAPAPVEEGQLVVRRTASDAVSVTQTIRRIDKLEDMQSITAGPHLAGSAHFADAVAALNDRRPVAVIETSAAQGLAGPLNFREHVRTFIDLPEHLTPRILELLHPCVAARWKDG